jgi:hypothetical protein
VVPTLNVHLKEDLPFVVVPEDIMVIPIPIAFVILAQPILVVPMLFVKIMAMLLSVNVHQNMLEIHMFLAHLTHVPSIVLVDLIQIVL